jgi:hypothetical protein
VRALLAQRIEEHGSRLFSTPSRSYPARADSFVEITSKVQKDGPHSTCVISVRDNGLGIPEESTLRQVWKAKQNRQLIFASHNANLVVNGDAELVAWCEHRTAGDQSRGTIAGEGAIDVPNVREAIKAIMEGGEAAFNLRREKYGF